MSSQLLNKITCDCCGKEIYLKVYRNSIDAGCERADGWTKFRFRKIEDLCPECSEKLENYINLLPYGEDDLK